jgi:hypothetical protein
MICPGVLEQDELGEQLASELRAPSGEPHKAVERTSTQQRPKRRAILAESLGFTRIS